MRKVLALAAVAVTLAAAPASAHMPHFGPHGWGPGWGLGAIGLGLGLGAFAYEESSCLRSRPVYDRYSDYVGDRTVNVCY